MQQQEHQQHPEQPEPVAFDWTEAPPLRPSCKLCGKQSNRLLHNRVSDPTTPLLCEPCWKLVQTCADEFRWKRVPVLTRIMCSTGFLLVCALTTLALTTVSFSTLAALALLCFVLAYLLELWRQA